MQVTTAKCKKYETCAICTDFLFCHSSRDNYDTIERSQAFKRIYLNVYNIVTRLVNFRENNLHEHEPQLSDCNI